MSYKDLSRIEEILRLNAERSNWVNKNLYRLMYKRDLYIVAYERIKSNAGNMTKGSDDSTIDGFSIETIDRIIKSMRDESFKFKGARRVEIPKANGKTRALGIAPPRDKVVQEVMRMILEAIYEPTFHDLSHGFRPDRGCHTALKEVRNNWSGVNWIIEGDIKGFFDNINHSILIGLLRKRIDDERFLNLIQKALKAGYFEFGTFKDTISGTPQGSIVSPILANVCLHEFDEFVDKQIIGVHQRGEAKKRNPESRKISYKLERLRKRLDDLDCDERAQSIETIRLTKKKMLEIPSSHPSDDSFVRIKYIRYADDWMIGVNGSHELAHTIREQAAVYLRDSLDLTLSMEKTHIRHAKTEAAFFLGTSIKIGRGTKIKKVKRNSQSFTRRVAGWTPSMFAPTEKLIRNLYGKGLCDSAGNPKSKGAWTALDDIQIVEMYNGILRGLLNYYSFVDNFPDLTRVQYIVKFSAAKTLAGKHRTSVRKIFKKYGDRLTVRIFDDQRVVVRTNSLALVKDWASSPTRFMIADRNAMDGRLVTFSRLRTRSKLYSPCVICGEPNGVAMHHVKHVRKMGKKVRGFTKLLAKINRKQIPVCKDCHLSIHNGSYDGLALKDFKLPFTAAA
ncbi:reverse transcriptase/maturase family protein [Halomonas sp. CSM-2]|uniref:reverse transcriptase/maturase family protein n=1 Tax=Halomonas sp. CSM-2 TaxID=1975722 RepID=UPI000A287D46|nr:reverse transcriptase/maturase family protein [Halomonas sp. CSM-2]